MAYKNEYSSTELVRIEILAAEGKTHREIGAELGRSRRAIEGACRRYGIGSKAPVGCPRGLPVDKSKWKRPYTETELNKLIRWAPHHSISELALLLDRTIGSVSGTCAYYKIKTNGGPGGASSHRSRK